MIPVLIVVMAVALFASGASAEYEEADHLENGEEGSFGELSLGPPDLPEFRTRTRLASGLDYTKVVRGETSEEDSYAVDVVLTEDREYADEVAERLREDGHESRVEEVSDRPQDDPEYTSLFLARSGEFDTEAEAAELAEELEGSGYGSVEEGGSEAYATPSAIYTGEDGSETTGPWVVGVIEVSPGFEGEVVPRLATSEVSGKEKLTGISSRADSLAAVNGGYFVVESEDGTEGDLAGVSVIEGDLVSEAVNGRSSLLLPEAEGEPPRVAEVHTSLQAQTTDGERRVVDGLNREPGLVRSCGGAGGDEPTERPKHDSTCTDDSELILFTEAFGDEAEAGEGAEVTLDSEGRVTEVRGRRGGGIPEGGAVLSGTGTGARWLEENAGEGEVVSVSEE